MAGTGGTLSSAQISQAIATMAQYDLAFQVSPIILVGGIAAGMQGGMMPIVGLYGQLSLFSSGTITDPSQFFARYLPLPGSTLISNQVATYPFANQNVAANAIIVQPLTLSVLMLAPVNQPAGYLSKLSTWTALQQSLQQHIIAGGTFNVATPAFVYQNLLLTSMTDVSHGDRQYQIMYQLDFLQPLLTAEAAAASYNNLLSKFAAGQQVSNPPNWSGNSQAQLPAASGYLTGALGQFGAFTPNVSPSSIPGATNASAGAEGL